MTAKENQSLLHFLANNKEHFTEVVMCILNELEKEIKFTLKVQKASIQLCSIVPFAVICFRRSMAHVFVEFYNPVIIDNPRIIRTIIKSGPLIIHRLYVFSSNEIDTQLITWIKNSYLIVK